MPALRPGSSFFHVDELPAYAPSGAGEHLYVHLTKEGLTTDQVAEALAKACGVRFDAVGYAGRKDRHGVTSQWFSIHLPGVADAESRLAGVAERLPSHGTASVRQVTRHANKLRLGHLQGNRFRLGLEGVADAPALERALLVLVQHGIRNRFGAQRFGVHQATLQIARRWGAGDLEGACAAIVDPVGSWKWGEPLPEGFRHGAEGRVLGALRHGSPAGKALHAGSEQLRKLVASAAQSAIFNAVLDARERAGLLHRLRPGDIGCTTFGAPFLVTAEDADATSARCAPGVLDAFATGPLPGQNRVQPVPDILAEEQAWCAADPHSTGIDWTWFARGGALESPGERRPLLMAFREPPTVQVDGDTTWVSFALPSGGYATEVLSQVWVGIPADRRG